MFSVVNFVFNESCGLRVASCVLGAELAWQFLHYLVVAVADKRTDEVVGQGAEEVQLVPMLLVHVPGGSNLGMAVAQFKGIIGLALQHEPFGTLQIDHGEDTATDAECQGGLVEGEVLGYLG